MKTEASMFSLQIMNEQQSSENGNIGGTDAAQIREELSQVKAEFASICSEVQEIQKEQRQMAQQFQTEMRNLVNLIQMAQSSSSISNGEQPIKDSGKN